jgi:thiamine pyrophosphokinase
MPEYSLLICNGEMAAPDVARQLAAQAASIVCADGGANAAREMEIVPDTVIGDFDSITEETRREFESRGVEMLHLTRQNDTDFEKALILLRDGGATNVAIMGLTGKLLDHTLGNFSILLRYAQEFNMILYDPHFRVDVLTQGGSFTSHAGDRISVVPLKRSTGVTYTGLRYSLTDAELAFGELEGTCNQALGESFGIHFKSGVLLLFRPI